MRKLLPLLFLLLLVPLLASSPASAREERSWRGLDVPYLSGGELHFRGNAAAEPYADPDHPTSLVTVAATRTSAILQADDHTLFELPARRGELRLLTRRLVGIPMADPAGDWTFFTVERGRRVRLMGYDARRDRLVGGPRLARSVRVWAVDGSTAYVGLRDSYASWTPGGRLVRTPVGEDGLLVDVDHGHALVSVETEDSEDLRLLAADGTTIAELPDALGDTFDPTGRFVSLWFEGGVWDVTAHVVVRLRLGRRWEAVHQRWAPTGELVVIAQDAHPDRDEENPARRFVCDPATGACDRLPDPAGVPRYTVEHEPFPSSAFLQVAVLVGS